MMQQKRAFIYSALKYRFLLFVTPFLKTSGSIWHSTFKFGFKQDRLNNREETLKKEIFLSLKFMGYEFVLLPAPTFTGEHRSGADNKSRPEGPHTPVPPLTLLKGTHHSSKKTLRKGLI